MSTFTSNYQFILPDIDSEEERDTWGEMLNGNFASIDELVGGIQGKTDQLKALAYVGSLDNVPVGDASVVRSNLGVQSAAESDTRYLPLVGRRNLIINGNFSVNQRGKSTYTSTGQPMYTADRWRFNTSGATGSVTVNPPTVNAPGYLSVEVTKGDDYCGVQQYIENVFLLSGRTVTVTFEARSSTPRLLYVRLLPNAGSGFLSETPLGQFTPTSQWEKYSITGKVFPVETASVDVNSTFTALSFDQFMDASTAAWNLDVRFVQVEIGEVSTPFEQRLPGEELSLCQRYYYVTNMNIYALRYAASTDRHFCNVHYPTTMRVTPALSGTTVNGTITELMKYSNNRIAQIYLTSTSSSGVSFNEFSADAEL